MEEEEEKEECVEGMWHFLPFPWGLAEYSDESMMFTRVLDTILRALALALEIILHFAYHFQRHTLSGSIPHHQSALAGAHCKYRKEVRSCKRPKRHPMLICTGSPYPVPLPTPSSHRTLHP
jgi:hypothetical protein